MNVFIEVFLSGWVVWSGTSRLAYKKEERKAFLRNPGRNAAPFFTLKGRRKSFLQNIPQPMLDTTGAASQHAPQTQHIYG